MCVVLMALSRSLKTHYLCRINWGNWGQIPINLLTPCRLGRRSPPLRGNVRVGPPAMSFVRSLIFLRLHFCSATIQNDSFNETASNP
jgi:hypothetical protein